MTTPRKHKEIAIKYFSDDEMGCWIWRERSREWEYLGNPLFNGDEDTIYYVGKEEPTEPPKIMCELAGIKFPMPEKEKPEYGKVYYTPNVKAPEFPDSYRWYGDDIDGECLNANTIHLNKKAAIKHGEALAAATKAAIEKAGGNSNAN